MASYLSRPRPCGRACYRRLSEIAEFRQVRAIITRRLLRGLGVGEAPGSVRLGVGEAPRSVRLGVGEAPRSVRLGVGEAPRSIRLGAGEAPCRPPARRRAPGGELGSGSGPLLGRALAHAAKPRATARAWRPRTAASRARTSSSQSGPSAGSRPARAAR